MFWKIRQYTLKITLNYVQLYTILIYIFVKCKNKTRRNKTELKLLYVIYLISSHGNMHSSEIINWKSEERY